MANKDDFKARYTATRETLRSASKKYLTAASLFAEFEALGKDAQKVDELVDKYKLRNRSLYEKDCDEIAVQMAAEKPAAQSTTGSEGNPEEYDMPAAKAFWKALAVKTLEEKRELEKEVVDLKAKLAEAENAAREERDHRLYKVGLERGGLWAVEKQLEETKKRSNYNKKSWSSQQGWWKEGSWKEGEEHEEKSWSERGRQDNSCKETGEEHGKKQRVE